MQQMSVNVKRRIKLCMTGVVTTVFLTLFCLFVVSSRHFGDFRNFTSLDTMTSSANTNSSDICTVDVFRNYYTTMDYFPGAGRWENRSSNNASLLHRFVPDLCKFYFDGFRSLPGVNVRRCLRRRQVTRIATVGDSNAARYYAALLAALVDGDDGDDERLACVNVAAEEIDSILVIPDVRYFARHDRRLLPLLHATARHCSSCVSRVHRCSLSDHHRAPGTNGSQTLWLEHVSMVSLLDSSLKIDVPHNHFVVNLRYRADTFQVATDTCSLHSLRVGL